MTHHDSLRLLDSSRAAPPTRNSVLVINMPLLVPGYLQQQGGGATEAAISQRMLQSKKGLLWRLERVKGGGKGVLVINMSCVGAGVPVIARGGGARMEGWGAEALLVSLGCKAGRGKQARVGWSSA
jgi:hypothetical protein